MLFEQKIVVSFNNLRMIAFLPVQFLCFVQSSFGFVIVILSVTQFLFDLRKFQLFLVELLPEVPPLFIELRIGIHVLLHYLLLVPCLC